MRCSLLALTLAALGTALAAAPVQHDLLILNGMVIDGTGNPGIYIDVAVDDGVITAVGPMRAAAEAGEVDAGCTSANAPAKRSSFIGERPAMRNGSFWRASARATSRPV